MQRIKPLTALGYTQITVSTVAVGLASGSLAAIPKGAVYALIRAANQDVRWRDDGTAPTAALGIPLKGSASEVLNYDGNALGALQFIRSGGVDGVLDVAFYGN